MTVEVVDNRGLFLAISGINSCLEVEHHLAAPKVQKECQVAGQQSQFTRVSHLELLLYCFISNVAFLCCGRHFVVHGLYPSQYRQYSNLI